MTNTRTEDADATLDQIRRLQAAGCQIVRLAVPNRLAARALPDIRRGTDMPLVADIHFDYTLALAAVEAGFDKIRINPGNIGSPERVRLVADACRDHGVPIRIGVNSGSVEKELLDRYGLCPRALCESAMGHARLLTDCGFEDICISVKASDPAMTVETNRLLAKMCDFPLHIGVTEAGTKARGILKSAAGIGSLLLDGIGDTIRVSLTAPPEAEITAALRILDALGLRPGRPQIISCPTCGRTRFGLIPLAEAVEAEVNRILASGKHIALKKIAVMGCEVNGPGEAADADVGVAGGNGRGVLFKRGVRVASFPEAELLPRLVAEIHAATRDALGQ
jgi:(E)-4-hydroxy-3-methylbut-2-enyl-diphosphate synthase